MKQSLSVALANANLIEAEALNWMKNCQGGCNQVPQTVVQAVHNCFSDTDGNENESREARTNALAIIMARQGWRFCRCYRMEQTPAHSLVIAAISPIMANRLADEIGKNRG